MFAHNIALLALKSSEPFLRSLDSIAAVLRLPFLDHLTRSSEYDFMLSKPLYERIWHYCGEGTKKKADRRV